jgi:hypothetical protein
MYEGKLPAVNFATEGYWTIEQIEASTGRICPYAIIYHNDEPVTIIEVP